METLLGDRSKAKDRLRWELTTTFEELVREMVQRNYASARRDELAKGADFRPLITTNKQESIYPIDTIEAPCPCT